MVSLYFAKVYFVGKFVQLVDFSINKRTAHVVNRSLKNPPLLDQGVKPHMYCGEDHGENQIVLN